MHFIFQFNEGPLLFGMRKFVFFRLFTEVFQLNTKMIIHVCGDCLSLRLEAWDEIIQKSG